MALAANVIATTSEELAPDQWLTTSTHPDDPKNGATLLRAWAANGLDPDWLPDARQDVHIFQSACASVKTKRASNGHGERIEIAADEVQNNGTCDYQITVKVWDLANKVIEHEKAMRVTFNKRTSTIKVDHLGYRDVRLKEIEQRIRDEFVANAKTVPGQKIRNAIREVLLMHGAQNLRRKAGGLYFVPAVCNGQPTKPILDGLAGVLEKLYGDRADFYTIKLVMDDGAREMVRKHFTINASDHANDLAEKAWQRVRTHERKPRAEYITNLWQERRKLMGQFQQFQTLVGAEYTDIEAAIKDLDEAIAKLEELRNEEG